jgi:FtsZ-binding cell division protein ZapB
MVLFAENGGAGEVGAMVSQSELDSIRQELAELRANTVSREEYEQVKREVQQLKEEKEAWQAKHSKLLTDLMEEVDEEKKIRLATEVEMKRIKKMVQP